MVFCVGAVQKTVSFDVPSDVDVARAEVEHQQPAEDFCVVFFVRT